ncbi:hypothetical protein MRY87_01650 [bacterium]|nr:hypothetical protein [bacterium]
MWSGRSFLFFCVAGLFTLPGLSSAASPDRVVSISAQSIFTSAELRLDPDIAVQVVKSPYPYQNNALAIFSRFHRKGAIVPYYGGKPILRFDFSTSLNAPISDLVWADYDRNGKPDLVVSSELSGLAMNGKILFWNYGDSFNTQTKKLDLPTQVSLIRDGAPQARIGGKLLALPSLSRQGILTSHWGENALYMFSVDPAFQWRRFAQKDRSVFPDFGSNMGLIRAEAHCHANDDRDFISVMTSNGILFSYDPRDWRELYRRDLVGAGVISEAKPVSSVGADLLRAGPSHCDDYVVPNNARVGTEQTEVAAVVAHHDGLYTTSYVSDHPSFLQHPATKVATLRKFGDDQRFYDRNQNHLPGAQVLLVMNEVMIQYFSSQARPTSTDIESVSITCDNGCMDMQTAELNGDGWDEVVVVDGRGADAHVNIYSHGGSYILGFSSSTLAADGSSLGSIAIGIRNTDNSGDEEFIIRGPALQNGDATRVVVYTSYNLEPTSSGVSLGLRGDERLRYYGGSPTDIIVTKDYPVEVDANGNRFARVPFNFNDLHYYTPAEAQQPNFLSFTLQAMVVNGLMAGNIQIALSPARRITTVPHIQ